MNFIYSAPNALGEKQCNRIIKYFELHPEFHQQGTTQDTKGLHAHKQSIDWCKDFNDEDAVDLMIEGVSVPDQSAIPEDMRTSVRVSPSGNFDITSPGTFDVVVTNGSGGTILVDGARVQKAATHIAADEQSGLVASDITFDLDIETAAVNADGSPGDTQTAPAFVDSMDNTLTRIVSTGYNGTFTR